MNPEQKPSWRDVAKNIAFIAIAIGAAYYVTVSVGIDDIRDTVETAGALGPLIVVLLKATTIVVVPLGGMPLYPIAGALFGFWKGLAITLIGDALGSTVAFYLSRLFGRRILHFFMSRQHLPMVEKLIERGSEIRTFLKARIFFAGIPELFAYAAGLTKISFFLFIIVHVGIHAIANAILVMFGHLLVSGNLWALVAAGAVSTGLALSGLWWFHLDMKRSN